MFIKIGQIDHNLVRLPQIELHLRAFLLAPLRGACHVQLTAFLVELGRANAAACLRSLVCLRFQLQKHVPSEPLGRLPTIVGILTRRLRRRPQPELKPAWALAGVCGTAAEGKREHGSHQQPHPSSPPIAGMPRVLPAAEDLMQSFIWPQELTGMVAYPMRLVVVSEKLVTDPISLPIHSERRRARD